MGSMDAMERGKWRLHQLTAHLTMDQASLTAVACMGSLRRDGRVCYARPASNDAQFMRPAAAEVLQVEHSEDEDDVPLSLPVSALGPEMAQPSDADVDKGGPLFGKPAAEEADQVGTPLFARSTELVEDDDKEKVAANAWVTSEQPAQPAEPQAQGLGFQWFPRMDVVESGTAYVITVELPGVSVEGIRVEVDHGSLVVTGSRATDWWKIHNGNGGVYHRQELAQGPYRAVWRLPKNGDISNITAEFIDGFLRVLVPKTRVIRLVKDVQNMATYCSGQLVVDYAYASLAVLVD